MCFVPVLSQTNAVYFIRRESTSIHKIGIKKNGALFLKRIFKERKHFLFNLLDLKMKFTQLLRHFFFSLGEVYLISVVKKILKTPSSLPLFLALINSFLINSFFY